MDFDPQAFEHYLNNNNNDQNNNNNNDLVIQLSAQDRIVLKDMHKTLIRENITKMSNVFVFLEEVEIGVYNILKYTPPNVKDNPLFQNELNPAMRKALVQNIQILNSFQALISSLGSISIILRKGAEVVDRNKGKGECVAIAASNMKNSFTKLDEIKEKLKIFDIAVLETFDKNAETIMNLAGPDVAASWVNEVAKENEIIDLLRRKIETIETEKSVIIGEIQSLNEYLISLAGVVNRQQEFVNSMVSQLSSLQADINVSNDKMNSIPETIKITETHTSRGGWFFRRRSHTTTVVKDVRNPNRDADRAFHQEVINSKVQSFNHISDSRERANKQQLAFEKDKSDITNRITFKREQLKQYLEGEKFKQCWRNQEKVENQTGLRGDVLVNFLAETRSFIKASKSGATAVTPIIGFIDNVQSQFLIDFQMFESQSKKPEVERDIKEIYAAGKSMLCEIGLLDACIKYSFYKFNKSNKVLIFWALKYTEFSSIMQDEFTISTTTLLERVKEILRYINKREILESIPQEITI
ncbi:hypothetical protein PPL_02247 [Heterostelium album PN500]|uniref:Uncharacterized protein n=1 Tax=Heterostelium pallidum (strain ATCC 26659 / Pp 5 / PN500) TaxID=670386 RepID=D3B1S3_HETP5|nr:hypothetical protein PPL_02247 [Heterostelium album PN500]EFA85247.1 hypothetical protein PPL_02247 [Heterostelium album PN500]|eukprot:XP_020437356.1 hypothetical protein PPL_02247 [Heterostelium album PN500]